jgi:hypothetical protein
MRAAATRLPGGEVRCAAGLLRQSGDGGPVDGGVLDRLQRKGLLLDEQIRGDGVPVEVEREAVRREDLAERYRRRRAVNRLDERVIDAERS